MFVPNSRTNWPSARSQDTNETDDVVSNKFDAVEKPEPALSCVVDPTRPEMVKNWTHSVSTLISGINETVIMLFWQGMIDALVTEAVVHDGATISRTP